MDFNNLKSIKGSGFRSSSTVAELQESNCYDVTDKPGIYLVLYANKHRPEFDKHGTGGNFKKKDPNKKIEDLEKKWIENSIVIYIGKATSLRERLHSYMRFGQREPAAHWGGRYIWQIKDSGELKVCWRQISTPEIYEKKLLRDFKEKYGGRLPFANLRS